MMLPGFCHENLAPFLFSISFFLFLAGCGRGGNIGTESSQIDIRKLMRSPQQIEVKEHYGQSLRGIINATPILVLRGNYEELGEAHGALAGAEIIQLLDNVLIPYADKHEPNSWESKVIPAAAAFAFPSVYERELTAILRGMEKKYPKKHDRMLSTIKREIRVDDLRALNCIVDIMFSGSGCSSFSAWGSLTGNGNIVCGRNLDERFIPGRTPSMVLAREPTELNRQATIEISGPGIVGATTAMNADGLIIMFHNSSGLPAPAAEKWIPSGIVLREAIESARANDSADQIARLFMNRSVRSGSNTHIALPKDVHLYSQLPFVLEWDGNPKDNGVTVRVEEPSVVRDAIVCTNHFVKRRPEEANNSKGSHQRWQLLASALQKCRASNSVIGVERAAKIMDSVARNGEWVTYLTVIAFPSERKMIFATTPGNGIPATRGEWTEITWDRVFGAF